MNSRSTANRNITLYTKYSKIMIGLLIFIGIVATLAALMSWLTPAMAEQTPGVSTLAPEVIKFGFIAAALATGLSTLGAGYAVAVVGSAAIGALTEKPELLGRVLILVGLAEGIAIYGLIVSILILNKVL
jgi:V/A-type H+-transporting ATPase subunit K